MKRYQQHVVSQKRNLDIHKFQDQSFDQEKFQEDRHIQDKYRSVEPKKMFIFDEEQAQENEKSSKKISVVNDLQVNFIVDQAATEKLRLDNFFGSKNVVERKKQTLVSKRNPQNIHHKEQSEQDENQRIAKIVRKQIQDKKRWQAENMAKQKQSNVIQSPQNEIKMKKLPTKNILKKINEQMYEARNIQKNMFQNKAEEDNDQYFKAVQKQRIQTVTQQVQIKKKKSLNRLSPLKKKLTTHQVLNQFQMIRKRQQTIKQNPSTELKIKPKIKIQKLHIQDLKIFNSSQIPQNHYIQGQLIRIREFLNNSMFPQYNVFLHDQSYLVSSKKTMSGYDIAADIEGVNPYSNNFLGYIKGNLLGTIYNLYGSDHSDQILATIIFKSQFSTQSITRDIQIYVKHQSFSYKELDRNQPTDNSFYTLEQLYNQGQNMVEHKINKYINKKPLYIEATKSYKLDFAGKVTVISVKNAIIIDPSKPNQNLIVFGKVDDDKFYLKVQSGFSMLVVMAFLMSSFNFKLLTQ